MTDHTPFLSMEQVDQFNTDGFLVLPRYFTPAEVGKLRAEIESITATMDPAEYPIFTTDEQDRKVSADYFLKSADKIVPFMEEKSASVVAGGREIPFHLRVNKIGHALHDQNEVFRTVSYDPKIGRIAKDLGSEKPLCVQSMYIFKQPNIGGEVGMHQDGTFLYTEPQTCIGFWWALDDCNKQNGCLYAIPGSHKGGVRRHFRRKDGVAETEFVPAEADSWERTGEVPLECSAGTLVLIHGAVVHYSASNTSPFPRHAYSIHTIDGRDGVIYPASNWLQHSDGSPFNPIPVD